MEILALENENTECNREIKSEKAQGAPTDEEIRETTGIGFHENHANIMGQAIGRSIRNQNS